MNQSGATAKPSKSWKTHETRVRTIVQPDGKVVTTKVRVPIFPQDEEEEEEEEENLDWTTTIPDHELPSTQTVHEPCPQAQKRHRPNQERKEAESAAWVNALPLLRDAYLESLVPLINRCLYCPQEKVKEEEHILLCRDCGPTAYYCNNCFHDTHRFSQLHVPLIWVGTMYLPYVWDKEISLPGHTDHDRNKSHMTVIDQYGRQHHVRLVYCSCLSKVEALLKLGLWPATPTNPVTAIDLRFMELFRCMLLEGGVALYKFASIMTLFASHLPSQSDVVDVHKAMAMDCAAYHRRFAYDISYFQGIVHGFPDGSECPICLQTDDILPRVISMDGNFRLVRKKSSGTSVEQPHHEGRFFISNSEAEPYLKMKTCAHDVDCSEFKAGTPSRAAFKADKLDVTGVFGSICVHDYPQLFIDMNSAEKLGYAVCIIDTLRQKTKDVKFLYDVACRLQPQLKTADIELSKEDLAVPKFHGYAHILKCQIEYNPRNKDDFRMADGENTERLWSELASFIYISKQMTPSNRRDLLVDALLHIGHKAIQSFARKMKIRLKNARAVEAKSSAYLENILQPLRDQGIDVSSEAIDAWASEIMAVYNRIRRKSVNTWQMTYVLQLKKLYALQLQTAGIAVGEQELEAQAEITRLEEILDKTERTKKIRRWDKGSYEYNTHLTEASNAAASDVIGKMHQEAVNRSQFIVMKNRARGHEAVQRASKQIQRTNAKLTTLIRQYNAITGVVQVTYEQVKDAAAEIYNELPSINDLPFPTVREVIRLKKTIDRVQEEFNAVRIEFPSIIVSYQNLNKMLHEAIQEISPPQTQLQRGIIAAVTKRLIENEKRIEVLAFEMERSVGIKVAVENHYSNSIPTEYLQRTPFSDEDPEEEQDEEQHEQDEVEKDDYHPSDDEIGTDDEL